MKKKILSILLVLVLAVSPILSVSATSHYQHYIHDCPYIYVHGFMSTELYKVAGDRTSEQIWPPQTDKILETVKASVPSVLKYLVNKDADSLFDALFEPLQDLLCTANLDFNGEAGDGSGIDWSYPPKSSIKKDSDLVFRYDWRLSPVDLAAQLNDYIEYVCDAAQCDKVCLEGHSFGGIVLNTYTTIYGTDRIKSICYNTSAVFGESYTGQMLSGEIVLNGESLVLFLKAILGSNTYSAIINAALDAVYKTGLIDNICSMGNDLIMKAPKKIFTKIVLPMFAGWLSIWAMIPDEYVSSSKAYVFDTFYAGDGEDHSGLINKIDKYNNDIRPKRVDTLEKTNEDCNLYVISRYDFTSVPLTRSWDNMSDSVIDTKYSSFGATCSTYKTTLTQSYLDAADAKYISPNKKIDASTCMFPNQTWFIRSFHHAAIIDDLETLTVRLLYSDGQATIDTYEEYPQYLHYVARTNSFEIDKQEAKKTFIDKVKDFFNNLFELIKNIFKREG